MNKRIALFAALALAGAAMVFAQVADGTYTAKEGSADEHGYVASIAITVKKGAITKIVYDEVSPKAKVPSKWKDKVYNANMKKVSGTAWVDAIVKLEDTLKTNGSAEGLDAVAGATAASSRFKALAVEALKK